MFDASNSTREVCRDSSKNNNYILYNNPFKPSLQKRGESLDFLPHRHL